MNKILTTLAVLIFSSASLASNRTIKLDALPANSIIRIPLNAVVQAGSNDIYLADLNYSFNCALQFPASDRARHLGEVKISVQKVKSHYTNLGDVFQFAGEYEVDGRNRSNMILVCRSLGFAYVEHLSGILHPYGGSVKLPEVVPY